MSRINHSALRPSPLISPCREHQMKPLSPGCSLGIGESSLFSAFPMSEKLILVKEEEEKGNKMFFGRQ